MNSTYPANFESGIANRELVLIILMPICAVLLIIGLIAILLNKDRSRKKKKLQGQLSITSKKPSILSFPSSNSLNDNYSNNLKNTNLGNFDTILEETAENSLKIEFNFQKDDTNKEKDANSINSNLSSNSDYLELKMRI